MNPVTHAKKIISNIMYLTLATCNRQAEPWNTPVYCAYDAKYTFYWLSWKENQHSKNIKENKKVFAVIYDSTVPEGTGVGVYLQGEAFQLTVGMEMIKAIRLLYGRKNGNPRKVREFQGLFPRRIFKFVPQKIWINSASAINGNYVDHRIDITKDLLKS